MSAPERSSSTYAVISPGADRDSSISPWSLRFGGNVEEDAVYFGIQCHMCGRLVPLVEVISAPHVISWNIPHVKPFRAMCDACGAEQQYVYEDLFVFLGPPPQSDFDVHPVFKYINF